MPTITLTARAVSALKATGTATDYFDTQVPGLTLRLSPAGTKSWTIMYRHRARLRRLTLGKAAVVSLADARERARNLLHEVSQGADPATQKQDGRTAETIADLATLYITKHAKPKKKSWRADDNLLRRKILPRWRARAIVDITRRDVRQLVEQVAEDGSPIVANRVAALLSKMFSFALDRDLVTVSPAVRIPRPGQEHQRDRVLTEDELRSLWASFDALDAPMAAFYKLRLLTAQRGGEVADMRWQDVDLAAGWWTIPSSHSKNKLAHRVPLSASVVTLLETLHAAAAEKAVYVLAAHHRVAGAGARGKRQQSEAAATFTVEDFRGHDLRRTAASLMTGGGVSRLIVSKILNHAERGVTAVYDRHSYDDEKRGGLDWWAARLYAILSNTRGAVLPFARRG